MEILLEMPQHYSGAIVYQNDAKFPRMSARSATEHYVVLEQTPEHTYFLHPGDGGGFVFLNSDLKRFDRDIVPVMVVSLRDTPIKGYRQAHHLRIRSGQARLGVATRWYGAYVQYCGGVVSDREHLEGGKTLWRALIDKARERGFKVALFDLRSQSVLIQDVTTGTPDPAIWSHDATMRDAVLVMELVRR